MANKNNNTTSLIPLVIESSESDSQASIVDRVNKEIESIAGVSYEDLEAQASAIQVPTELTEESVKEAAPSLIKARELRLKVKQIRTKKIGPVIDDAKSFMHKRHKAMVEVEKQVTERLKALEEDLQQKEDTRKRWEEKQRKQRIKARTEYLQTLGMRLLSDDKLGQMSVDAFDDYCEQEEDRLEELKRIEQERKDTELLRKQNEAEEKRLQKERERLEQQKRELERQRQEQPATSDQLQEYSLQQNQGPTPTTAKNPFATSGYRDWAVMENALTLANDYRKKFDTNLERMSLDFRQSIQHSLRESLRQHLSAINEVIDVMKENCVFEDQD